MEMSMRNLILGHARLFFLLVAVAVCLVGEAQDAKAAPSDLSLPADGLSMDLHFDLTPSPYRLTDPGEPTQEQQWAAARKHLVIGVVALSVGGALTAVGVGIFATAAQTGDLPTGAGYLLGVGIGSMIGGGINVIIGGVKMDQYHEKYARHLQPDSLWISPTGVTITFY